MRTAALRSGLINPATLSKGVRPLPRYPEFPSTTLAAITTKASLYNGNSAASDVSVSDSPYGLSTAPQIDLPASSQLISTVAVASPCDVRNGHISFEYKTISGISAASGTLTSFKIRLYSSGSPAAPPANYTETGNMGSYFKAFAVGRWQRFGVPISWFNVIGGSGATLSAVTWARIEIICGATGATIQLGYIRFYPNPLSQAKVIFRWDDAVASAYTIGKPLLDAIGKPGFLAPGAVASAQGFGGAGRMTLAQVAECRAAGWQVGSQSYSTESAQADYAAYLAEYRSMMAYAAANGYRTDAVDGTFYSSVGPATSVAASAMRAAGVRTIQRFDNGNAENPPNIPGETFPFADEFNIRSLNMAQPGGSGATITTRVQQALSRAITDKGVLILAMHDDLTNADALQAFNDVISTYNSDPTKFDITTPTALLTPYLALYGPKTYLP